LTSASDWRRSRIGRAFADDEGVLGVIPATATSSAEKGKSRCASRKGNGTAVAPLNLIADFS